MRLFRHLLIICLGCVIASSAWGRAPEKAPSRKLNGYRIASDCLPPSASAVLDINNVRALLHNGGDMWWDLVGDPRYEIPKGSNRHSLFAGSLWVGGIDEAGQLRIAAQTYRQGGIDYWPGPLTGGADGGDAATDQETCDFWNQMFKINKTEIDAFRADWSDGVLDNAPDYPNVLNWPAVGNPNNPGFDVDMDGFPLEAFRPDGSVLYAAPFVNVDDDPLTYNPNQGDYPMIDGDQAIWWIINDKGNNHTETGGQPIGIEIHMLAFGFTTANAVNDMTFYRQTVVNRSSQVLNDTYIGQWVDADIGFFNDDYVGCDTLKGLGIAYNGDADDEGPNGYGANPPAVGVDFFQGPLADPNDGVDNDKDGLIDEPNETIIMSKFIYYNNDFSLRGNPEVAQHFYGYLTGFWKDGTPVVDNFSNGGPGNGYPASGPGDPANYMFSGDPCTNSDWTEANADNPPFDRRFIQSAGPFTLRPGSVNEVVTGVVWARGFFQDQFGSVCELIKADNIAQALFDNSFQLLDGPDAPELIISEYDRELLLTWDYPQALASVRNNFNESYRQSDPVLKAQGVADSVFEFEGYLVYQLVDGTVGPNELNDPDRARVVAQCDVQNGVTTIANRSVEGVGGLPQGIIIEEVMVEGSDEGIVRTVPVTRDLFAEGSDTRLRNYSPYYFAVIAYAYNDTSSDGRNFIPGNRFYRVVTGLPHPEKIDNGGTVINAEYGEGLNITLTNGCGNGGNFLRITEETEDRILQNNQVNNITYVGGSAPIEVKVIDPKKVQSKYYRLTVPGDELIEVRTIIEDTVNGDNVVDSVFAEWILFEGDDPNNIGSEPVYRATYVKRNDGSAPRPAPLLGTERPIEDRGISISVRNVAAAGDTLDIEGLMGVIGGELSFEDESQAWLSGLGDNDNINVWDWLLLRDEGALKNLNVFDKFGYYSDFLGGSWGPFVLARAFTNSSQASGLVSPGVPVGRGTDNLEVGAEDMVTLDQLPDVDVVFTADITKWSRCVVVETSPNNQLGSGAWPMSAKWRDNVDQSGASQGTKTPQSHGLGWFPGYAINIKTGDRLNIFFGESEWDKENNGNDMIWNPTSNLGTNLDRVGGRHYIYVTDLVYDECQSLIPFLTNGTNVGINNLSQAIFFPATDNSLAEVYKHVAWTGVPLAEGTFDITDPTMIPTDARVSLRVNQPFRGEGNDDFPTFTFNTATIAAATGDTETAKECLDNVLVVPNPYYGYSSYETGQLDNRVRITNLPQRCRISIFTPNGYLVRQYNKDSETPFQDWDLKNHSGVPIASGVYIIHVDGNVGDQNLGEKVVKLFAVTRKLDLDNF